MEVFIFFNIVALILSIVLHEVSHGYAALALGDPTARLAGRLTLNPIKHIDPLGSVILPALLVITGSAMLVGWAKPVPYNPYNLRNAKWGEAIVAGAGPAVNFILAIVFGILVRLSDVIGLGFVFTELLKYIVLINIVLGVFNLFPIPPLDGSRILKSLLPYHMARSFENFEHRLMMMGPLVLFGGVAIIAYFLWPLVFAPIIFGIFSLITGGTF